MMSGLMGGEVDGWTGREEEGRLRNREGGVGKGGHRDGKE